MNLERNYVVVVVVVVFVTNPAMAVFSTMDIDLGAVLAVLATPPSQIKVFVFLRFPLFPLSFITGLLTRIVKEMLGVALSCHPITLPPFIVTTLSSDQEFIYISKRMSNTKNRMSS